MVGVVESSCTPLLSRMLEEGLQQEGSMLLYIEQHITLNGCLLLAVAVLFF